MFNEENKVQPTSESSNDAKPIVSTELTVMAQCDECGRDIMSDEVALARNGIMCYDCCKKMWGMD